MPCVTREGREDARVAMDHAGFGRNGIRGYWVLELCSIEVVCFGILSFSVENSPVLTFDF